MSAATDVRNELGDMVDPSVLLEAEGFELSEGEYKLVCGRFSRVFVRLHETWFSVEIVTLQGFSGRLTGTYPLRDLDKVIDASIAVVRAAGSCS